MGHRAACGPRCGKGLTFEDIDWPGGRFRPAIQASLNTDLQSVTLVFPEPIQLSSNTGACSPSYGVTVRINGTPATITGVVLDPDTVTLTVSFTETVAEGDALTWEYSDANQCLQLVETGEGIGDQSPKNISNPTDTTAPTLQSATIGPEGANVITCEFSKRIQSANFANGWSVAIEATNPNVVSGLLDANGRFLYLQLDANAGAGDTVTLSYASASGDITDQTGWPALNPLANITNFSVANTVPDSERPNVLSFVVNGGQANSTSRTLTVDTFDAIDDASDATDMEYMVNETPSSPPSPSDPRWVSYANRLDPYTSLTDGQKVITGYVKDEAGNVSLGIGESQQNVFIDSMPPWVVSAEVDATGKLLTINFNEDIQNSDGFTLTADAASRGLSNPQIAGNVLTFTCATVQVGQTALLSYAPGNVTDLIGNALQAFSDFAVTNNSTIIETTTLEFHAVTPDPTTNEMQGVAIGTGGLTEGRTTNIWVKDYQGVYQEFAANEPAYQGGRVTGPVGSRVVYADDGVNPLPEAPYLVMAASATNKFLNSHTPATQTINALTGFHTCWLEGAGQVDLSGAATGTVTDGNPVTFDAGGGNVTFTVSGGTPDFVQVEDSGVPTLPIPTTTAAVTRAASSLLFDGANHDDTGLYYVELYRSIGETDSVPGEPALNWSWLGWNAAQLGERFDAVTGRVVLNNASLPSQWYNHRPDKWALVTSVADGLTSNRMMSASRPAEWISEDQAGFLYFSSTEIANINVLQGLPLVAGIREIRRYDGEYADLKDKALELVANPVPAPPTFEFHAITPDQATNEMLGLARGVGGITEGRNTNIWIKDYQGVYREFAANELAYQGGRVTGAVGSRVVYADDGVDPLPEAPYLVHAPAATNLITRSRDLDTAATWTKQGSAIVTGGQVGIDGSSAAYEVEDANVSGYDYLQTAVPPSVTNGTECTVVAYIKKDATGFPGIQILNPTSIVVMDPATGNWHQNAGASEHVEVQDEGLFWKLVISVVASSTTMTVILIPGRVSSLTGPADPAATGKAVYDHVQLFDNTPFEVARFLPPVPTDGASVTRSACSLSFDSANHNDSESGWYGEYELTGDSAILDGFLSRVDPNAVLDDGTNQLTAAAATGKKQIGLVAAGSQMAIRVDAGAWVEGAYDGTLLSGALDLFRSAALVGNARNLQRYSGTYESLKSKIDELMP